MYVGVVFRGDVRFVRGGGTRKEILQDGDPVSSKTHAVPEATWLYVEGEKSSPKS